MRIHSRRMYVTRRTRSRVEAVNTLKVPSVSTTFDTACPNKPESLSVHLHDDVRERLWSIDLTADDVRRLHEVFGYFLQRRNAEGG